MTEKVKILAAEIETELKSATLEATSLDDPNQVVNEKEVKLEDKVIIKEDFDEQNNIGDIYQLQNVTTEHVTDKYISNTSSGHKAIILTLMKT